MSFKLGGEGEISPLVVLAFQTTAAQMPLESNHFGARTDQ